jgi:hypothetical protein
MDATDRRRFETQYYGCCVVDLYNEHRTHAGVGGRPPESSAGPGRVGANVSSYRWQVPCRGLYHTPIAA